MIIDWEIPIQLCINVRNHVRPDVGTMYPEPIYDLLIQVATRSHLRNREWFPQRRHLRLGGFKGSQIGTVEVSNHTETAHMEGVSRSAPLYLDVGRIINSRARTQILVFRLTDRGTES